MRDTTPKAGVLLNPRMKPERMEPKRITARLSLRIDDMRRIGSDSRLERALAESLAESLEHAMHHVAAESARKVERAPVRGFIEHKG